MKTLPDRICRLCGNEYRNLSHHLRQTHKITNYQVYYDEYVKVDGEGLCHKCGVGCRFASCMYGYHDYCSTKCSNNSEVVKRKKVKTSKLHYGVNNPNQCHVVREKIKNTLMENYGVTVPLHSEEIRKRSIETSRLRYGVDYTSQYPATREKYRKTCMLKFGVDNPSKTFKSRLRFRHLLIDRINKMSGKIRPMRGGGEELCFDELEHHIKFQILRDVSKIGYFPDGYIEELSLVVEFDEPEHQTRTWYRQHDIKRDMDFEKIGCLTYRIKQIDWMNDKQQSISDFVVFCEGMADSRVNSKESAI